MSTINVTVDFSETILSFTIVLCTMRLDKNRNFKNTMHEFNLPTISMRAFAIISERTRTRIARLESNVSMTDDCIEAVPRNHPGSRE